MNPEIRLNSVVLPAPFGPIRPTSSCSATWPVTRIDRDEPLELPGEIGELEYGRAAHRQPTRLSLPPQASPNCRRSEIERRGFSEKTFGQQQNAQEHDGADGDHAEIADAAQRFRQDDQEQAADHGARQAAEPANDHHGEDVDQLAELELVRADEIGGMGEQRARRFRRRSSWFHKQLSSVERRRAP